MKVIFYRENDGTAPCNKWLDHLPTKAQAKYVARPKGLQDLGYDLPRPEADYL